MSRTYSYLVDDGSGDKKTKDKKKCVMKKKCLGTTQLDNKINYLEKKTDIKNSEKNNKLILKTQQKIQK